MHVPPLSINQSIDWIMGIAYDGKFNAHYKHLHPVIKQRLLELKHGDMPRWQKALQAFLSQSGDVETTRACINQPIVTVQQHLPPTPDTYRQLHALSPWRKGPFQIANIHINSEWRSDMKWCRIAPFLPSLQGKTVLDIGSGNGYYALRMLGIGARHVLGVDPSLLLLYQFAAIKHKALPAWIVPTTFEYIRAHLPRFDCLFSMGVLYHRPDWIEHLHHMHQQLSPSGHVVLETIVLPQKYSVESIYPAPNNRYAQMNNVWSIHKADVIIQALKQQGFSDIIALPPYRTTPAEQRQTAWMRFHSLPQFIDETQCRTIEGYPAPIRQCFIAQKAA